LKRSVDPKIQKIAYYNADLMPPPNSHGIPYKPNRKEAVAAAALLETPEEALTRVKAGGAKPKHYVPTPPLAESDMSKRDNTLFNPYAKSDSK